MISEPISTTPIANEPPIPQVSGKRRFELRGIPSGLTAGVAVVTSILSIAIAVASYLNTTRPPETSLVMPKYVRISQNHPGTRTTADVTIQPTFIIPLGGERPEVITDLKLQVTKIETGETGEFRWHEIGKLTLSTEYVGVGYEYIADPSPLLITATSPQLPVVSFLYPKGWRFQVGTYRVLLIAQRSSSQAPLQGSVEIDISELQAEGLARDEGKIWRFDVKR